MTEFIEIVGGKSLQGTIKASGAKNAALPMLMAALLSEEEVFFQNIPNLLDVDLTVNLLEQFGAEVKYAQGNIAVKVPALRAVEASYSLVKALRASFWVLGPLLARGRAARVALPGGDAIGTRPVDIHLNALTKMGADITLKHGVVFASAVNGLRPAEIDFSFPSVGATHQIMMAAALTKGTTVLKGAACEPEVIALADLLNKMGAKIEGAGTPNVAIVGQETLGGAQVSMIGDRIEAGTYLLASVITGGDLKVEGIDPNHLGDFLEILSNLGATVETSPNSIRVIQKNNIRPINVTTEVFPGFATDLQAPLMAALTLAEGESTIEENIFEGRFAHVQELARMGANINVSDRTATITGVRNLSGAPIEASDIRGGAALILAGLAAEGVTSIGEIDHIRRGYEKFDSKLRNLGAQITCRPEEIEDIAAVGC